MDALARLGATAVTMLAQAAGIALGVVVAWQLLLLILSGGDERAFARLLKTLLTVGIAMALLTHIPQTIEVITLVGGTLVGTVVDAVRGAGAAV
jgi:hypothetical protein